MSIGPDVQYPSHRKIIANRENKGDKFKKKKQRKIILCKGRHEYLIEKRPLSTKNVKLKIKPGDT